VEYVVILAALFIFFVLLVVVMNYLLTRTKWGRSAKGA